MSPRMPLLHLTAAGLLALAATACSSAPPPPVVEPVPPPPRVDAKTQLEYGAPPPRGPRY